MSVEKIIERIQNDAEKQIKHIMDEAEKQSQTILKSAKVEAEKEAESILMNGQLESENEKKILISKAIQDIRRDMMNAREEIIEQCFSQALEKLASLSDDPYRKLVIALIKAGKKRLGENCTLSVSRTIDKEIAKQENVTVQGTVKSRGGIILHSADGTITIDNTFERVLNRKKDEIRIHVGKLLFPV
jgi:V/A-type H+-transporting ATPase subunit E